MTTTLRTRSGLVSTLPVDDWSGDATPDERRLLACIDGPALDLGCGPGRLTLALAELGIAALGVDTSPNAVEQTLSRGASAICRSIFEPLPGEGRWKSVLLFDGNVGIGGDPVALLSRVRSLLSTTGVAYVEVGVPGSRTIRGEARLEVSGHVGPWFDWAWVSADDLATVAIAADLDLHSWCAIPDRWIARLVPLR